jgi:citrate lyase subunit beta / citryl-CoA lyase
MRSNAATALARSYLFAPGDSERLLSKVFDAGADAVVLDLEDAVAPSQKEQARRTVSEVLMARQHEAGPAIYVRINSIGSGLWMEDIAAITGPGLTGIRLAKAESSNEVRAVDAALTTAEANAGMADGLLRIVPTIESAVGVLAAGEMARADRVEALAFGNTDFLRDIGAESDLMETQTLYARSQLVLVSRAAGIKPPIASVHTKIKDLDGLRITSEAARCLGFFGRSCIHPAQIPVVNEVFTPASAQVAEARAIIEAFDRAAATGSGSFALENGQFVDRAVVERARALVELAEGLQRSSSKTDK